jgi:hypothetical protein
MQATLKPGEGYYKLAQLGDALYALWIDADGATGYRLAASATDVARKVTALRETISIDLNGAQTTYALDVPVARSLYLDLFGPVEQRLQPVRHLIFEPDGAMLQLPVNLLIASQAGVDAYETRIAQGGDEFDFRGIDWLGRDHAVSTALSARAFRDAELYRLWRQCAACRAGADGLQSGRIVQRVYGRLRLVALAMEPSHPRHGVAGSGAGHWRAGQRTDYGHGLHGRSGDGAE